MNSILNEFSLNLQFLFSDLETQGLPCSCCSSVGDQSTMMCYVVGHDDEYLITWICPECKDIIVATEGLTINSGTPISLDKIKEYVLESAKLLDLNIFNKNKHKPYVRRPTYAETQRAAKNGKQVPEGAALIVMQHDEKHMLCRALPMPFPWKSDGEWLVTGSAAIEALAIADSIESGKAEVILLPGGNCIVTTEEDALTAMAQAGGHHG